MFWRLRVISKIVDLGGNIMWFDHDVAMHVLKKGKQGGFTAAETAFWLLAFLKYDDFHTNAQNQVPSFITASFTLVKWIQSGDASLENLVIISQARSEGNVAAGRNDDDFIYLKAFSLAIDNLKQMFDEHMDRMIESDVN